MTYYRLFVTNLEDEFSIAILSYPGCMLSAVQGLNEMLFLTNDLCEKNNLPQRFIVDINDLDDIKKSSCKSSKIYKILIIPPNIEGGFYLNPDQILIDWIKKQHANGCIMSSICAGAFILAACGLLEQRKVTTHWKLKEEFLKTFPNSQLDIRKILINDGDVITAGGLMSWLDLGLELVAQFINTTTMRQLGKLLVVDTGLREQRYYQSFLPKYDHGDSKILSIQHYIQANYKKTITISVLAEQCFISERTFLRHFVRATGLKPLQYLQRVRIQKSCELLETTKDTVEIIASEVGYEDTSAFRKVFLRTVGLTPMSFRRRF